MVTLSWIRFAAAAGGLVASLTAGAGIASADPDLDPIVNSTCTYGQAMAALNAQDREAAARFNADPVAQGFLHQFIDSPPDQRLNLAHTIQGMPSARPYLQTMKQVAKTCNQYLAGD